MKNKINNNELNELELQDILKNPLTSLESVSFNSDVAKKARSLGFSIDYAIKAGKNAFYFDLMLYLKLDRDVLKKCLDEIERLKETFRLGVTMENKNSDNTQLEFVNLKSVKSLINNDDSNVDFIHNDRGQFKDKNMPEFFKNIYNNKVIKIKNDYKKKFFLNIFKITEVNQFNQKQIDIFTIESRLEQHETLIKESKTEKFKWLKEIKELNTKIRDCKRKKETELMSRDGMLVEVPKYKCHQGRIITLRKFIDLNKQKQTRYQKVVDDCKKKLADLKKPKFNSPLNLLAVDTDSDPMFFAEMNDEMTNIDNKVKHIENTVNEYFFKIKDKGDRKKTEKNMDANAQVYMCFALIIACNCFLERCPVISQKNLDIALGNMKIAYHFIERCCDDVQWNIFKNNEVFCRSEALLRETYDKDGNKQKAKNQCESKKQSSSFWGGNIHLSKLSLFKRDNNPEQNNHVRGNVTSFGYDP